MSLVYFVGVFCLYTAGPVCKMLSTVLFLEFPSWKPVCVIKCVNFYLYLGGMGLVRFTKLSLKIMYAGYCGPENFLVLITSIPFRSRLWNLLVLLNVVLQIPHSINHSGCPLIIKSWLSGGIPIFFTYFKSW